MFTSFPFAFWRGESGATGLGYRYGYQSDGVDEGLNFGNVLPLDYDSTFSLSFWIKTTDTTKGILGKFNGTTGYYLYLTSAGKLSVRLYNGTLTRIDVDSTNIINDGEWKHCVCTYDGSTNASGVKIYIDAVLESNVVNDDTLGNDTLLNASDLEFASVSSYLNGRLDDVQYYDFVLNATQVSDIYNSGYVTAPTASPIYHWKLGEEDTFSTNWTVKDSVGSLDGTSVNMEEVDRKLGVAYSLDFDGVDEEISFPNYDISGPFSVSVWFKLIDSGNNVMIGDWGSGTRSWLLRTSSGNIDFFTSQDGSAIDLTSTALTYNDNSWHNVLVTFGSTGGKRIYLDGSLVASVSTYYVVYNSSNNLLIGDNAFSGQNFDGNMMEVSIYDTELSASDVALLFNETGTGNGVPIDPRNVGLSPTFYCPMVGPNDSHDGTNWTITDEIGGNNGTSVNMEEADKTSDTP
jgi:hypothetical protein